MKRYKFQEVKDFLKEKGVLGKIREDLEELKKYKEFYIFEDVKFDYLKVPDEELDGLYACIIGDNFVPTDGISYILMLPYDYILFPEDEPDFLIIPVEASASLQNLPEFDADEFLKEAEIDIDFEEEEITLHTPKTEARFDFAFEPLDDIAEFLLENNYGCRVRIKVQEYILDNFEVEYDRYKYCTRGFSSGILKVDDKEFKLFLDNTGNCFSGGFSFENYEDD